MKNSEATADAEITEVLEVIEAKTETAKPEVTEDLAALAESDKEMAKAMATIMAKVEVTI